jgi:hypothetical protein
MAFYCHKCRTGHFVWEEYRSGGVTFRKPIHHNSDNVRGFEIEDSDGYVLFFGRPNL